MQSSSNLQTLNDAIPYSIGLVIICFLVLMVLWLPDIIRGD